MEYNELWNYVRGSEEMKDIGDSELYTLFNDAMENFSSTVKRESRITLPCGEEVSVFEYEGEYPHCKFTWTLRDIPRTMRFDNLFDGVEHLMNELDRTDSDVIWNWYLMRDGNGD